jgi:galactose mutarotase-like enzyme
MRGGVVAGKHGAFCLETQMEPNAVNSGRGIYNKGDVYVHSTVYRVVKR